LLFRGQIFNPYSASLSISYRGDHPRM